MTTAHSWALVLAAGDGTRVSALTRDRDGVVVPKQFCKVGERTLLARALDRAAALAPPERTLAVVAAKHRRWWDVQLSRLPPGNVVVQPENRGTAAGALLPLLEIARRDPRAVVTLLPADHLVADEPTFASAVRSARAVVDGAARTVALLGITPDRADGSYGWILPGAPSPAGEVALVARFVEKPGDAEAAALLAAGGSWNSFVVVARVSTLLELFRRRQPMLLRDLAEAAARSLGGDRRALAAAYATLPVADFSRDLLEGSEEQLRLVAVPPCGWDDLGTPERLVLRGVRLEPPAVEPEREPEPVPRRRAPLPPARYPLPGVTIAAAGVQPATAGAIR